MKTIYTLSIFLALIGTTACNETVNTQKNDASTAIPVKVTSVGLQNENPFLTASGKIEAVNSAALSTRSMGFVNQVNVNVGDKVNKGQLLVSINNTDLTAQRARANANITEAKAAFKNAEKDYLRFKNLFADKSASQKELDDRTVQYQMAEARMNAALQMKNEIESQFTYVNLRSPFSGKVTQIATQEGDMAKPGIPLIWVEAPGSFEVNVLIPESEIAQIQSGAEVSVNIKAINTSVKGTVTELSSSAKNTGGQYMVTVVLQKSEAKIFSGMYAAVEFLLDKQPKSDKVLLPLEAIVSRGQLKGIYTVSANNTAVLRWLRLGHTFGDKVEVLSGLTADEDYILSANGKLYNGAKISISN